MAFGVANPNAAPEINSAAQKVVDRCRLNPLKERQFVIEPHTKNTHQKLWDTRPPQYVRITE
ncbi:MAG: hypothetical protein OHK0047_04110 [Leptolyngbyaceae cyanobacterium]